MPELPEVQTTVDGINKVAKGHTILDVWTDFASSHKMFKDSIKNVEYFKKFKKKLIGAKILKTERRAKNILIHTDIKDVTSTLLIHMKMTGHVMYGMYQYNRKKNEWMPKPGQKALEDPFNRFLHLVLTLDNGKQLVLSDVRKFAKVALIDAETDKTLQDIGPEPLASTFTKDIFLKRINKYPNRVIKTTLMDQALIAGIGNIYSDEILFVAKILPWRKVSELSARELATIYKNIKPVLEKGIDFGGDSTSDYRNIHGERGKFQGAHQVYRRTKQKCLRKGCKGVIERKVIGGRSAHYCMGCQG
ncbi:MAG: hypothetical protein RJB39_541 [Candidatus Parcubacteria bacterium]|jgi:formamidopyrimidine-DNA glycosylase